jgi:hypothetical protein
MSKEKRKQIKGYTFYHKQNTEDMKRTGKVRLAFSDASTQKYPKVKVSTVEVGNIIVETASKCGLDVEWDGTEDRKILVW